MAEQKLSVTDRAAARHLSTEPGAGGPPGLEVGEG